MSEISVLMLSAASIAFFHTLIGPDHYLPFVMMARAGHWSLRRTLWVTFLCGIGHVASSVLLGALGIAFGLALSRLVSLETSRGSIAAWALICFGLFYFVWGLRRAWKGQPHAHPHLHDPPGSSEVDGATSAAETSARLTPWLLFTIFVLGPCEPLIPLLMYPAAKQSLSGVLAVTAIFGLVTLATMLAAVWFAYTGLRAFSFGPLERFSHAIAGATIALSGLAIQVLGV